MVRGIFVLSVAAIWTGLLQIPVTLSVLLTWSGEASLWMARNLWAPVILWSAGVELEADPLPALDHKKPYVFMSNHQGFFDIPAACATIPNNVHFVAKKSLGYVPILGWYIRTAGHILIDRSKRQDAMRSLEQAGAKIAKGKSIIIYPEGTRSRDGIIRPFKKGPFVMAIAAQVPIVPIAVEGTKDIMTKGAVRMTPGRVRIRLGEPVPTAGLTLDDREDLMRIVHDRMIDAHLAIGGAGGDREKAIAETERRSELAAAANSTGASA
jgi:1-acyl-sn-glycerol-3-phosphate acyltransferase